MHFHAFGPAPLRPGVKGMDRPIRPESVDFPAMRRAYRAARRMRWLPGIIGIVCAPAAWLVGSLTVWYVGLCLFLLVEVAVMAAGYSAARCPKCGQVWGINGLVTAGAYDPPINELSTCVCRKCRIEIGPALREKCENAP